MMRAASSPWTSRRWRSGSRRSAPRSSASAAWPCWCPRRWPGWPRWPCSISWCRRIFGPLAGFLAALALALTPIAVAVERSNNTDTWLMFTLLLAAWAMTLATEKGAFRLLALSMALVGVAFNIKMLEAWIVLPTFFLLYLVAAPLNWKKRLLHLTLGGLIVLGVSLSWPVAVDLTPASLRPWVGGSQTNSVLELALGYNGLGRITGQGEIGRPGRRVRPPRRRLPRAAGIPTSGAATARRHAPVRRGGGRRQPRPAGLTGPAAACSTPGSPGASAALHRRRTGRAVELALPAGRAGPAGRRAGPAAQAARWSAGGRRSCSGAAGWSPMAPSSAWPRASSTPTT